MRLIDADKLEIVMFGMNGDGVSEEAINNAPTVEAVPMEKIDEILDKFSKWLWSEHEDVCGNQMIDIGYAEGYLRELFDWERKWEDEE